MSINLESFASGFRNGDGMPHVVPPGQGEPWMVTSAGALRALVVGRLAAIIADPETTAREVTAAVRALTAFLKVNPDSFDAAGSAVRVEEPRGRVEGAGRDECEERCGTLESCPPARDTGVEQAAKAGACRGRTLHPSTLPRVAREVAIPAALGVCARRNTPDPAPLRQGESGPDGQSAPPRRESLDAVAIVQEDPGPATPALQRRGSLLIFRAGSTANLGVTRHELQEMLPPCPERDLVLDPDVRILRADGAWGERIDD